jgi:hypothetical protein
VPTLEDHDIKDGSGRVLDGGSGNPIARADAARIATPASIEHLFSHSNFAL